MTFFGIVQIILACFVPARSLWINTARWCKLQRSLFIFDI